MCHELSLAMITEPFGCYAHTPAENVTVRWVQHGVPQPPAAMSGK